MHKHTKLSPKLREEVYAKWCQTGRSFRSLGKEYHVDKNVIGTVIERGRKRDFSVHDSTNHRYRKVEFGIKKLAKAEEKVRRKLEKKIRRYEKHIPGEMIHGDTKRLPFIEGENKRTKREVLYVAIDDCTRFLAADILPDKTQWSSAVFLKVSLERFPFAVECHYSDNGKEYRGKDEHAFVALCDELGIERRYTKVKHPWTNGKAERVVRTLLSQWFRKNKFTSYEQRRKSLYRFVEYYNHQRKHLGIGGKTPVEKLRSLLENGDNA
jgi:transposase InsO family protein